MFPNTVLTGANVLALLLALTCSRTFGEYFSTLDQAYSALGFDPRLPGNSVIVFFSDAHMNLDITGVPYPSTTTNIDWRLFRVVNAMDPPAAKVISAGDQTSSMAALPGGDASHDPPTLKWATNEMVLFGRSIRNINNVSRTNILWIPGNHDQGAFETNAETFCKMLPGMPPYQTFEHNGIRFFLLNSGNYGDPSESERVWLKAEVAKVPPTQPVICVTHQPPFHNIAAHRGMGVLLRDLFKDWQTRWWVLDGHEHAAGVEVYNIGRSNVAQLTVGPATTNTFVGFTHDVGFCVFCLNTNGVAGQIYYHYDWELFEVVRQPDWDWPTSFVPAFESVQGLLWRRFKVPGKPPPEMVQAIATDSVTWWAYPSLLRWVIPLSDFRNKATHFLLLMAGRTTNTVLEASVDLKNWVNVPWPEPHDCVYAFPLSKQLLAARIAHFRLRSRPIYGNNWVGGWGLADSNLTSQLFHPELVPVSDQRVLASKWLMLQAKATDRYSPPDVLEYSMVQGPEDAAIDPLTGDFRWRPSIGQAPQRVRVEIRVEERGTPHVGSNQEFWIDVLKPAGPILTMAPGAEEDGPKISVTADPGACTVLASTNATTWRVSCTTNGPDIQFSIGSFAPTARHKFFQVVQQMGTPELSTPGPTPQQSPYVYQLLTPESRFIVMGSDNMIDWEEVVSTNVPGVVLQIADPNASAASPPNYRVQSGLNQ